MNPNRMRNFSVRLKILRLSSYTDLDIRSNPDTRLIWDIIYIIQSRAYHSTSSYICIIVRVIHCTFCKLYSILLLYYYTIIIVYDNIVLQL